MKTHGLELMVAGGALLAALIGCSGNESQKPAQAENEKDVNQIEQILGVTDVSDDATDVAQDAAAIDTLDVEEAESEDAPVSSFLSKARESCQPSISGNQTDADQDRIKSDSTVQFNCNRSGLVSFSLKGSLHIKDENDNLKFPKAGFSAETNNVELIVKLPNGRSSQRTSSSKLNISVSEGERHTSLQRTSKVLRDKRSHDSSIDLEASTIADDPAAPRKSGTIQFDASYSIKSAEKNIEVTLFADNLKYSQECAPRRLKEGVIKITSSDGRSKVITLENCKVKK